MSIRLRTLFYRAICAACLAVFPVLTVGCQSLSFLSPEAEKADKEAVPALPSRRTLRISQFLFSADFPLKKDLPLFKELEALRDQIYRELQLPAANVVVQVYLFEDRDRYERFMRVRYPELPKRRAFFVAQPKSVGGEDLLVYTYWGDRIQQDLRHELTHALLHSVLKDVPLWLDEGLAEFYEMPASWKGTNYQHLEAIRRGGFQPNLARLEQLSKVEQMAPPEYREAWAWVHLMLRGKPEAKTVLLNYLQQLRTNPNPGPLGPRLATVYPSLEETLSQYLAQVDTRPRR